MDGRVKNVFEEEAKMILNNFASSHTAFTVALVKKVETREL